MIRQLTLLISILILAAACRSSRIAPQQIPEPVQESVAPKQTAVEEQEVIEEKQTVPAVNFYSPETWIIGYFKPDLFYKPPHDAWYHKEYNSYEPKAESIFSIQEAGINGVTVLIVLGTWCGDSRREVPRFLKMLDQCGLARIGVTFLGVDMNKFGPVADYEKLGIVKVPTFIVYRNNIEAGRIIEYPSTSLEGDFLEILRK
jgi:hypothetical protein